METAIRSESSVRFEGFELDLRTGELYRNGFRFKLRGRPVDVLAILLEHPGELVTRETFKKRLWPENTFVDFEQILNNSVGKLREALGDQAESPKFIETLPRLGYRFIAPVEKSATSNHAPEAPNQGAQDAPTAEPDPAVLQAAHFRVHRTTEHRILWMGIAVAGIFTAFAYLYLHRPRPAPRITHYEQLTLDGRRKVPIGTDGTRVYMRLLEPGGGNVQVPVSGGKVTEFPIELPGGDHSQIRLASGVSPDGANLLVRNQYQPGEGWKIWVVGILGRPARYLTRAYLVTWSPDGQTVLYTNEHGDFYTIGVNGGEPRLLHRDNAPVSQNKMTNYISWSPDGTTIRYTTRAGWGRIFEISSTGSDLHEFLPGWNGSVQKCCGAWTGDGRFYVFLAGPTLRKGPGFPPLAQIWAVDERRDRMRPRIPEPFLLASYPLLWGPGLISSRDGKKIFARGVSLRGELERHDPRSKRLEPYLGGISVEMPDFSRDGKYVAYISFPEGILWRANRDGSAPVQLTQPPLYPRNPRWSPDGTQILFVDNLQNGMDALYLIPSQGGTPKRLLPGDGGPQSLGDWSPDGKRVVFTTDPQFSYMPMDSRMVETRIVELATGKVTILPKGPEGFYAPLWSPDGRYIAGQSFDTTTLAIFDLRTGEWRDVFQSKDTGHSYWTGESIGCHNWSHDSRFLYFLCWIHEKAGVYRVSVHGGKVELVFDLPEGFRYTGWYDYWMSLDPDDAPLIFRDVGTDEIYGLTLGQRK